MPVTLRISSPKEEGFIDLHKRPDYTFLHDWFGDTFRYMGVDKEKSEYDIVQVRCSPYAMVNWALQYSDRVDFSAQSNIIIYFVTNKRNGISRASYGKLGENRK